MQYRRLHRPFPVGPYRVLHQPYRSGRSVPGIAQTRIGLSGMRSTSPGSSLAHVSTGLCATYGQDLSCQYRTSRSECVGA
eukprot:536055-Rhodomonas_salina.5